MPQGYEAMLALSVPLALGMAAMASAFGLGRAVSAAMDAIARQPEAGGQIQTTMIIGCDLERMQMWQDPRAVPTKHAAVQKTEPLGYTQGSAF